MPDKKIILGSKSPRRQQLVNQLGLPVEIKIREVDEIYPPDIPSKEVASYLAKLKAQALIPELNEDEILLTSDTTVVLNDEILGKPGSRDEAIEMLNMLSDRSHEVITGVFLGDIHQEMIFSTVTIVHFNKLRKTEIEFYVDEFKPFDKAGGYGIQEWIGYIGVKGISGCYYNVMGLPVHDIYQRLNTSFL